MRPARPAPVSAAARALAALAALAGCDDGSTGSDVLPTPTALTVVPEAFLGDVPCSSQPGALQTYVATLFDVTDEASPFVLASSSPAPCSQRVSFRFVVPGHVYRTEIDGYATGLGGELVPAGGPNSGSRQMRLVTEAGLVDVQPRFRATCGATPETAARAAENVESRVDACGPLVDALGPGEEEIVVDPAATLGARSCASVSSFAVLPADPELPAVTGLFCGGAPVRYALDVVPGRAYVFRVEARSQADGEAFAAATCVARAGAEGLGATAVCEALSDRGAVVLESASVLEAAGETCEAVATISARIAPRAEGAPEAERAAVECGQDLRFSGLEPGPYEATVELAGPGLEAPVLVTCEAEAELGSTVVATCRKSP